MRCGPELGTVRPMNARVVIVIGLVGLLLVGGAAFWLQQSSAGGAQRGGTLSIVTTPAGAALSIEGKNVGATPWFGDNTWPKEPVLFELSLPGYRTWKGSFPGGGEARVAVTLVRRKLKRRSDAGVIDAGSMDIELYEEDDGPLHPYGPLIPSVPAEFVDEDLEREAAEGRTK